MPCLCPRPFPGQATQHHASCEHYEEPVRTQCSYCGSLNHRHYAGCRRPKDAA